MGTCSQYGITMEKLHIKTSLKPQRTLTLNIVLEQAVIVVFTIHSFLAEKWLRWKIFIPLRSRTQLLIGVSTMRSKCYKKIWHQNIVKLHGYCLHKRCMFLVYEYIGRGSLFCVLCNDVEAVELNWIKRVNIIKDITHAISYMHHECTPIIVHRDISSNNILLNN